MDVVGNWKLGEQLGRGAFGRTLRVTHGTSGRSAVAKVMNVRELDGWKSFELCERECRVLEGLVHPSIPRHIEHFVVDDTTLVLVMEEARGVPLARRLGERSASPRELVAWLHQGLEVLAYLHEQRPPVIHRDVTTNNLMVDGEHLTLIDFGAVKASLVTGTAVTSVGTFGFMAPEQLRGLAEPASDLFGLGVSMLCASMGTSPDKLPVDARSGTLDIRAIWTLPDALKPVVERMVEPGLAARHRSAREALADLDVALAKHVAAPRPALPDVTLAAGTPATATAPSHGGVWVFMALVFGGLGAWALSAESCGLGVLALLPTLFFGFAAASGDRGDPDG